MLIISGKRILIAANAAEIMNNKYAFVTLADVIDLVTDVHLMQIHDAEFCKV